MDTIIFVEELNARLDAPDWFLFDCRASLADPRAGSELYASGHIAGAVHADLERDLSGKIVPGETGRHPLPESDEWLERLRVWGVDDTMQVVAYDDSGGAFAARLWWMMRWVGHRRVAVLNGGWRAWVDAKLPVTAARTPPRPRSNYQARPPLTRSIGSEPLLQAVREDAVQLLDARDGPRYRGEVEPIDPVAGHIPGALSLPFADNLGADGLFKSDQDLARRFLSVLESDSDKAVVCYCGSGVTAAHTVLAMVRAGFEEPYLYPGSWSEWIVDPHRPVEKG